MTLRSTSFDCDGVQIRPQCRQLATVVTVSGNIDGTNVDRVSGYVRRFILAEKPFVLDLNGVNTFTVQSISLLDTVDDACRATGVEWSLIASGPVTRMLRDEQVDFPITASVPDALNHFADVINERRQLLPLLRRTA